MAWLDRMAASQAAQQGLSTVLETHLDGFLADAFRLPSSEAAFYALERMLSGPWVSPEKPLSRARVRGIVGVLRNEGWFHQLPAGRQQATIADVYKLTALEPSEEAYARFFAERAGEARVLRYAERLQQLRDSGFLRPPSLRSR